MTDPIGDALTRIVSKPGDTPAGAPVALNDDTELARLIRKALGADEDPEDDDQQPQQSHPVALNDDASLARIIGGTHTSSTTL